MEDNTERPLTDHERIFVDVYLQTWNKTKAAKAAKYARPDKAGWEVFKRPAVKAEIDKALETMGIDRAEILARLAQQASIDISDFYLFEKTPVIDEQGQPVLDDNGEPVSRMDLAGVNWEEVEKRGYLIKRVTFSVHKQPILEFNDSLCALELLAKHFGLFVERVETTNFNLIVTSEDLARARYEALEFDHKILRTSAPTELGTSNLNESHG